MNVKEKNLVCFRNNADMNADDYAASHFCILTRLSPFAVSEWPHIQTRQVASTQVTDSLNIYVIYAKCQIFYPDEEKEKHRKNCESCLSQVTWKVKFKCQFRLS